jgi:heat shock protein HslJ
MQTNISSPLDSKFSFFRLSFVFLAVFLLIACSNMLPSCNSCSTPPLSQLNGRWELLRWNYPPDASGKVQLRKVPHGDNGEPIIIEFSNEKKMVSGFSGCNRFFGTITTDSKDAVQISKVGSTRKMCMENFRMELERDFLNQLQDYRSLQMKDDQLILIGRSGDVLNFGKRGQP